MRGKDRTRREGGKGTRKTFKCFSNIILYITVNSGHSQMAPLGPGDCGYRCLSMRRALSLKIVANKGIMNMMQL